MTEPLVQVVGVSKSFGGVQALTDIHLAIQPGEVHALCGENGAGKSTLIKILGGALAPDQGEIRVQGSRLTPGSVRAAEKQGIAVIHQEAVAFPHLNAYDNIFLGSEPRWAGGWLLDRRAMRREARTLLARLGESFPLHRPVGQLPVALRQMVAIARALARQSRLVIMDEPTSSLSARETETLLRLVRQLQQDGVSILYVSHRLEEVFRLAQRVTILRDGRLVETCATESLDAAGLIARMVGRTYRPPERRSVLPTGDDTPLLEIRQLTRRGSFRDVSLQIARGEIVGLAGLVGAGRSELARAIFGLDRAEQGGVWVDGRPLPAGSLPASLRAGLALVPEDRQHQGLVLPLTVAANLTMPQWRRLSRWGLLSRRRERTLVAELMQRLQVKASGSHAAAQTLSGGNQQKLVLGKWLGLAPRVLLLDEPTRGVDVGAKAEIYRLVQELAQQGLAILLISSELPEILLLSHRILVMRQGVLAGELPAGAREEEVLALAMPPGDGANCVSPVRPSV
jgi:rhamnose transport system ATP-binding protein